MVKKIIWIIFAIVVIVLIIRAIGSKSNVPATSSESIKIGFIGPLTGYGAVWGEEQKNAVGIAVDKINQTGGIAGWQISMIYEDGKCDGKAATAAAQKLIAIDGVKMIISVCSAETLAAAAVAEKNKVLLIGAWSTNSAISDAGDYIFRSSYSDDDASKFLAEAIAKKYSTLAIITELNNYPVGVSASLKKYFTGQATEESLPPETQDVRTAVTKALSQKPQAVFINPNNPQLAVNILKEIRKNNFTGGVYANAVGAADDVIKLPEAQGMIFVSDPDVKDNTNKTHLFSEYENRYGRQPSFSFAVAVTYDIVYIIKQAVEKAGTDPTKIKDYLYTLKDFNGVMGVYGFNEKGDAVGFTPSLKQVKDGKVVSVQ